MDKLFAIQLISSFILGGSFVGLQAWASEKAPRKYAGIIVSLPSTIVVNLLFLGLILSPEEYQKVLPVIPAPLGFSFVFITTFIYIAKWLSKILKNKIILITICTLLASAIWLAFSLPFAIKEFSNLKLSLIIYLAFIVLAQLNFNRKAHKEEAHEEIHYSLIQQISRAAFAGAMVTTTIYLGKTLGPLWGGVMTMFPAAYLSAMAILLYFRDHNKLFDVFALAPIGSTTLIVYAFITDWAFPNYGVWLGTLIAFATSSIYSLVLTKITQK